MKTTILLIASGVILTGGIAMHTGNNGECPFGKPFGKPCQKLFKSEKAAETNSAKAVNKTTAEFAEVVKK